MNTNLTGLEYELYDYKEKKKTRGKATVLCFGIWAAMLYSIKAGIMDPNRDREAFYQLVVAFETVGSLLFVVGFVYLLLYGTASRKVRKLSKFINMQRGSAAEQ
jgi:uncharacterized YccA/Bax inhibitor family protein